MGLYGSVPEAPDPKETAAAQTSTNIGTAVANAHLNNVNQITPDGSLTYAQTGSAFTPSETGQTYYYNPKSGEYSTSQKITGYTPANPGSSGSTAKGTLGALFNTGQGGSAGGQPIYEDGWQAVKGMLVPTFTATQTLSPAQQAIKAQEDAGNLNLATLWNTQSNKLNTMLANPFTITGAPTAGDASTLTAPQYQNVNYDIDTSKYEDALMQRMNPQLQQSRAALEQRLADQGLQPGSPAYDRALAMATAQENDARYGAILNAGQEQSRLAGLETQKAGFNNSVQDQTFNAQQALIAAQNTQRANYLNEQYAQRNQNINEVLGLASGAQLSNPNFVNTPSVSLPTVDYAGLVNQNYQNQLAAYQQSQAGIGSILGGVASIFSKSDRDAKKDIKKVGGLYEYRYKDDPKGAPKRIGVMAQEVEKVRPKAVKEFGGVKHVNYGALFNAGEAH